MLGSVGKKLPRSRKLAAGKNPGCRLPRRWFPPATCNPHRACGDPGYDFASALLVDPLGFDAGDSNLYRYVNNAPTDATDPSGEWRWELRGDHVAVISEKGDTFQSLVDMGYSKSTIEGTAKLNKKTLGEKLDAGLSFDITGMFPPSVRQALVFQKSLPASTKDTDISRGVGNCYGFLDLCRSDAKLKEAKDVQPRNYMVIPLDGNPVAGMAKGLNPKNAKTEVIELPQASGETKMEWFVDLSTKKTVLLQVPDGKKAKALFYAEKMPDVFTQGRVSVAASKAQFGDFALFTQKAGLAHVAWVLGRSDNGKVVLFQKLNSFRPYVVCDADDPSLTPFGEVKFWHLK